MTWRNVLSVIKSLMSILRRIELGLEDGVIGDLGSFHLMKKLGLKGFLELEIHVLFVKDLVRRVVEYQINFSLIFMNYWKRMDLRMLI